MFYFLSKYIPVIGIFLILTLGSPTKKRLQGYRDGWETGCRAVKLNVCKHSQNKALKKSYKEVLYNKLHNYI